MINIVLVSAKGGLVVRWWAARLALVRVMAPLRSPAKRLYFLQNGKHLSIKSKLQQKPLMDKIVLVIV